MTATTDDQTQEKLKSLTVDLAAARNDEAEAKKRRIQAEEAIVALLDPGDKSTITIDPGNGLKVTVKTELGYKADIDEILKIDSDLIKATVKQELDVKAYEELRERKGRFAPLSMSAENAERLFARISEHVTVSPKKPSVSLKVA